MSWIVQIGQKQNFQCCCFLLNDQKSHYSLEDSFPFFQSFFLSLSLTESFSLSLSLSVSTFLLCELIYFVFKIFLYFPFIYSPKSFWTLRNSPRAVFKFSHFLSLTSPIHLSPPSLTSHLMLLDLEWKIMFFGLLFGSPTTFHVKVWEWDGSSWRKDQPKMWSDRRQSNEGNMEFG